MITVYWHHFCLNFSILGTGKIGSLCQLVLDNQQLKSSIVNLFIGRSGGFFL